MKISKKTISVPVTKAGHLETATWQVDYDEDSLVVEAYDGKVIVIEGRIFYCVDNSGKLLRVTPGDDIAGLVKAIYNSVGQDNFSESVEGMYNVAIIDEHRDAVSIFGDVFNRVNLFYCLDGNYPVISTEMRDVLPCLGKIEYKPEVFYCLLLLGYPPAKHTPYERLRRLALGEQLFLQNDSLNLLRAEVKPLISVEMGDSELDQYGEILENAIMSRSSQIENWVELSGWDSTVILAVLRNYFDMDKVRAVTWGFKYSDGSYFLPYAVEDAVGFGKHYNIVPEVVETYLGDARLPEFLNSTRRVRIPNFAYEFPLGYQAMADLIKGKGKPGAAVFLGNFSDSLHDFAFAHYASFPYLSRDFYSYGGKIRAYLYSPSFLKKVLNNTFEDDFAYRLFKWLYSEVRFTDTLAMSSNERVFEYLLSFVLAGSRIPFAPIATESVFPNDAKARFKEWLYENYFKDAVEQINCQNMYFWLIRLYQYFHLQGFEKGIQDACFWGSGKRVCQPYYDLEFVKFMQMVPENWGRGLEWRRAKYPLIQYGIKKLGVPYEKLESTGHHPTDDAEHSGARDHRSEIIDNSTLTSSVWKEVKNSRNLERFFDREWFNIESLNNVLQTGVSESGRGLPLRLLLILSTGFER